MTTNGMEPITPACFNKLLNELPEIIRHAAAALLESDARSRFFGKLSQTNGRFLLYLIERNDVEAYTVCHCFSTDKLEQDYAYESMPLEEVETFFNMAGGIGFTSRPGRYEGP